MAVSKRSLILLAPFAVLFALVATTNAAPLNRRQLINLDLGIINAPQNPNNPQNPQGGTDQTGNPNTQPAGGDDGASNTVGAAQESGGPLINISLPPLLGGGQRTTTTTQQTTTSTQPTSISTTPSATSQTSAPTPPPTQDTNIPAILPPGQTTETTVVVQTQTQDLPTTTPAVLGNTNGATSKKEDNSTRNTIIIVIASIAGGIGAIAIIWTIFRKWKLSPSDQFEERLNPIDWQPTGGMAEHHRSGSLRSNRSYGAAGSTGGGVSGSGGSATDANSTRNLLSDLPSHDFTAGPTGPVGGYADLRRGPSVGSRGQARQGAGYGGY